MPCVDDDFDLGQRGQLVGQLVVKLIRQTPDRTSAGRPLAPERQTRAGPAALLDRLAA